MMTLAEARRLLGLSGDEDAATVQRAYRRAIDRRRAQRNLDGIRQVEEAYELVREATAGEQASIDAAVRRPRRAAWENWYAWVLVFMAIIAARAVFQLVRATIDWAESQDQAQTTERAPVVESRAAPDIEPQAPVDPVENFARLADNAGESDLARRVRGLAREIESGECDDARQSLEDAEQRTRAAELSWLSVALEPVRAAYDRRCAADR